MRGGRICPDCDGSGMQCSVGSVADASTGSGLLRGRRHMRSGRTAMHGTTLLGALMLAACGTRAGMSGGAAAAPSAPASAPGAAAAAAPAGDTLGLGSRSNPVRTRGPFGEREYLRRLQCPDGASPSFRRYGSVGSGADGHILDVYGVECPRGGLKAEVFMDMYHGE